MTCVKFNQNFEIVEGGGAAAPIAVPLPVPFWFEIANISLNLYSWTRLKVQVYWLGKKIFSAHSSICTWTFEPQGGQGNLGDFRQRNQCSVFLTLSLETVSLFC